jgi:hypothetical protein
MRSSFSIGAGLELAEPFGRLIEFALPCLRRDKKNVNTFLSSQKILKGREKGRPLRPKPAWSFL